MRSMPSEGHLDSCRRFRQRAAGVVLLTPLLILIFACGGGGGTTAGVGPSSGTIGQICNTGDGTYSIELTSGSATATVTPDPIEGAYQGNIGGQIRGITSIAVTTAEGETSDMLAWGSGSSIKFGSVDAVLGAATMRHPGAITDLAASTLSGKQVIVYGTERGVGIAGPDADGQLTDYAANGAWRAVPSGVRSLTVGVDGRTVLFASSDGYLQQTTVDALSAGERCAGVAARFVEGAEGQEAMAPVKIVQTANQSFILSKTQSALTSVAPTFELVFNPFFKSMIDATPYAAVSTLSGTAVGFATRDESFNRFDRFIPTDIASDGTNLYVAGLAFVQDSVLGLLGESCAGETDQVKCLGTLAKNGKIEKYTNDAGLYQFVAGFFAYRNLEDLTKADHFSTIPISNYTHDENSPPLMYAIAVAGDQGYIRGPNFLTSMSRQTNASGEEDWRFDATAKESSGLKLGIPNRVIPYAGGAAASFTGVRAADGSGASALEVMGTDGAFNEVDTGAIAVRVEGVGETSKLVAAIEMASDRGGLLYLESPGVRKPITISSTNAFASRAAYNDVRLAFAWSVGGSLEASSQWRIAVQEGSKNDTRGEFGVNRTTNTGGEFDGFTQVTSGDANPGKLRGVADIEFLPDGNVAVLYSGYKSSKWVHQVGIYSAAKSSGKYIVQHVSVSKALESAGAETDHGGAILRATGSSGSYQVIFSTAAGIFKWTGTDKGAATSVVPIANAVDVTMDAAGGNLAAWITGFTLSVKDITKSNAAATATIDKLSGSTATRLSSARLALSGNALAVATPYSAANTFSFFNLQSGTPTLIAGTTYSRFFDVKLYSSFPDYLLANSQAGGIEMYLISDQEQ